MATGRAHVEPMALTSCGPSSSRESSLSAVQVINDRHPPVGGVENIYVQLPVTELSIEPFLLLPE